MDIYMKHHDLWFYGEWGGPLINQGRRLGLVVDDDAYWIMMGPSPMEKVHFADSDHTHFCQIRAPIAFYKYS